MRGGYYQIDVGKLIFPYQINWYFRGSLGIGFGGFLFIQRFGFGFINLLEDIQDIVRAFKFYRTLFRTSIL